MVKRIIALLMVLTMAICCTACAGKGKKEEKPAEKPVESEVVEEEPAEEPEEAPVEEGEKVKIASQETAGDFSVGVPEGFEFSIGDFMDETDVREFHVKKTDLVFFDFHATDEELAMQHYDYNKNTYTNEQVDFEDDYNGIHWTGFQYSDGFGGYGFEAYAYFEGRILRVSCCGYKPDDEMSKAVLNSVVYSGAPVEEDEAGEEIVGGWEDAEDGTITEELSEIFAKAVEGTEYAEWQPVELKATQVVAGTNYRFLCENGEELAVYEDLEGNCSILSE